MGPRKQWWLGNLWDPWLQLSQVLKPCPRDPSPLPTNTRRGVQGIVLAPISFTPSDALGPARIHLHSTQDWALG